MRGTKYKPFYQNFLVAAGDMKGDFHGAQWNDGDFYKFLEAVSAVYATTHDPELEAILKQSIAAIGKAQRADGYIHTPVLIRQRHGEPRCTGRFRTARISRCTTWAISSRRPACTTERRSRRVPQHRPKNSRLSLRGVSQSDAGAGAQFGLPVALHGDGRHLSRRRASRDISIWQRSSWPCETWSTTATTITRTAFHFFSSARRQAMPCVLTTCTPGAADLYLETGDATLWRARAHLEKRRREKDVHHGRLRRPVRRRVARRLFGPIVDHTSAPGLRPQLSASQRDGPQRNLRGDRQRAMELADVSCNRRGQVRGCT